LHDRLPNDQAITKFPPSDHQSETKRGANRMELFTDIEQFYYDAETKIIELNSGGLTEISVGLSENISPAAAMSGGWIIGAIVCWLVGWVISLSYSSSPTHSVLAKMAGWLLALPIAFSVGNFIGEVFTPHWWTILRTPFWSGYPFAVIWFAIAILGHEDRLEAIKDNIDKKINKAGDSNSPKQSGGASFRAPDPFATEHNRK